MSSYTFVDFVRKSDGMHDAIIADAMANLRLATVVHNEHSSSQHAKSCCILFDHFMPAIKGTTNWKHIRQQCANGHMSVRLLTLLTQTKHFC